jgi:hypothetical protein
MKIPLNGDLAMGRVNMKWYRYIYNHIFAEFCICQFHCQLFIGLMGRDAPSWTCSINCKPNNKLKRAE